MSDIILDSGIFGLFPKKNNYDLHSQRKKALQMDGPQKEPLKTFWGKRHLMIFVTMQINALLGVLRHGMGVGIVSMVNQTKSSISTAENSSTTCGPSIQCRDYPTRFQSEKTFDWSPQLQSLIISSSFIGYFVTTIVSGRMAEVFGAKRIIVYGGLASAAFTLVSPVASKWDVTALIVAQFGRGLGQGFTNSPAFVISANWIPRKERGLMNTIISTGYPLGSVVGALLVGKICDTPGLEWPASFYITGGVAFVVVILFALVFYEKPHDYPYISKEELRFITEGQETDLSEKSPPVPWKNIFTSASVYGLIIGLFGFYWSMAYFVSLHATFLGAVLHYPMTEVGMLTSLPYLAMFFGVIFASLISIYVTNKNPKYTDKVRKSCSTIWGVGFSLCFVVFIIFEDNKIVMTVTTVFAQLAIGIGLSGVMVVVGDMSPVFAGTISSVSTAVACIAAAVMPISGGAITENETFGEWKNVFYMNIGVVMFCAITFQIFGSAELQPWNFVELEDEKENKSVENQFTSSIFELENNSSVYI